MRGQADLFVAGVAGDRVLVVGKQEVRALALADGKPLWQCETGTPIGRGELTSDLYRLPVRDSDGMPELLTIELARRTVAERSEAASRHVVELLPFPEGYDAPAADRSAPRIAGLVRQLGSEHFAQREAAVTALDAIGPDALPALAGAGASQDPEVRRRATLLARSIDRRLHSAEVLRSGLVRLRYRETPLAEAAADFLKKTGVLLKLPGDAAKLGQRRITLDTGSVTFWEALDQFCAKAGLVEKAATAAPNLGGNTTSVSSMVIVGGAAARTPTNILHPEIEEKPVELQLVEGKPAAQPTSLAGCLRIRLAPADTPIPQQRKEDGELLFALEAATHGGLQWQKAVGLRLERALDEAGRSLQSLPTSFQLPAPAGAGRGTVIINGMPVNPPTEELDGPAARLIPVRLKPTTEQPVRKLRELAGTIVAQVRTAREPQVTVNDALHSVGKVFRGPHGGEVKVLEVAKDDDGQVRIKVQVEAVSHGLTDGPANPFGGTVIVNGRRLGEEDLLSSTNFALRDERDRPYQVVKAVSTGVRAGSAVEYELVYEPGAGVGAAAKFVYADRRTLFIDVPFTLKDLALP